MATQDDSAERITAQVTEENVRSIADLERAAIEQRSLTERVSDLFTRTTGRLVFLALHAIGFAAWITINLGLFSRLRPFDPFPFSILNLSVSMEGVFLAIFVLISQNRMTRQSNQRAHLSLQINLLAEQEITKLLQEVRRLGERLGVGEEGDAEVQQLSQRTHLGTLAAKLEKNLPGS